MGVPTSEVGYSPAMPSREDHEVHKGHVVALKYIYMCVCGGGPGSSVRIAADYGMDGPGSNPGGDEFFRPSRQALRPTQRPVKWVPGLPGGRGRRGETLTPHPLLLPWSKKNRAIPLLSLWTVRPVKSLSACTRVHFNFFAEVRLGRVT